MKVKELLAHKENWTKHACFRDRHGSITHNKDDAYSYCLAGAVMKCYPNNTPEIFRKIKGCIGDLFPSHWNDKSSYEEVMRVVQELDI